MGGQSRQGFQYIGAEETLCPTAGGGSSGADFEDGEAPRGHHQRKRGATWSPGRLFLAGSVFRNDNFGREDREEPCIS